MSGGGVDDGLPAGRGGAPDPAVLVELDAVLAERGEQVAAGAAPDGSHTAALLADAELAARKVVEEAFEVALEVTRERVDARRAAEEGADAMLHLLAALRGAGVGLEEVLDVLRTRRGGGGGDG